MPSDRLSPSSMLEREIHRRNNYPFVYFCPTCNRSCCEKKRQEFCRFCHNPNRLVTGGNKYVYFCEQCDSRIESDEPIKNCLKCSSHVMMLYRWDMLERGERRRIRFAQMLNRIKLPQIQVRKIKINKIKETPQRKTKQSPEIGKIKGEELPSDQIF